MRSIRFRGLKLRTKLFLVYFLIMFLPLLILSYYSVNSITNVIKDQSIILADQYFDQTKDNLRSRLQQLSSVSFSVSNSNSLREITSGPDEPLDLFDEIELMEEFQKEILNIETVYGLYQVRVYISDDYRYSRRKFVTYDLADIQGEDWYQTMASTRRIQFILEPYTFKDFHGEYEIISIVTPVRDYLNLDNVLGVVIVDMPVSELQSYLEPSAFSTGSYTYIIDGDGTPIVSNVQDEIQVLEEYEPMLQTLFKDPLQRRSPTSGVEETGTIVDDTMIYNLSEPIYSDWRIFTAASFQDLVEPINQLGFQLLIFAVIVVVVIYLLTTQYGRYIASRILTMSRQMKKVEQGDLEARCIVDSDDEIGELQNSFNFMIRRLNTLLDDQYTLGKELKEMEMRVLQSQINPHFLYNTLNVISWEAQRANAPEIVDIVTDLSRYYRISLSAGRDFILLKDEFKHVETYISLLNKRFDNQIEYTEVIEAGTEHCYVMKLFLQPIVENSALHGFAELDNIDAKIIMSSYRSLNHLNIIVEDNGMGMDTHTRESILAITGGASQLSQKNGSQSYGLQNIIQRFRVYYGDDFNFDIESELGRGTKILIRIPIRDEERMFQNPLMN